MLKLVKELVIFKYYFLFLALFVSLSASVDINTADADALLELDGIGKAKASKIIVAREIKGCFTSINELASIEGISEKLIEKNRAQLTLGACEKITKEGVKASVNALWLVLLNPINLIFVVLIVILALIDQISKKDFKSQIVSVGVLGTFVGIFIGLQGFDPLDIMGSVGDILVGLKTAFFTSIVGMSVATILTVIQKLKDDPEDK